MKSGAQNAILLKNYAPPAYLIETVHLDVSLSPNATRVRARMKMRPNPMSRAKLAKLVLEGEHLILESIRIEDRAVASTDYELTDTTLTLPRPPQKPFTLDIVTVIDPEANTALSGLYRSRGVYCSQCEAEGFRRITYYLDRPDVLATFTTRIEADREDVPVLLGNGNPIERGTLDRGRRHYAVWHDPHPKPSYLFALVGGKLSSIASTFTTASRRNVNLTIYVEPGKEARCGWAMDCLKRSMRWDEEKFGREYDLDVFNIVAVSDFNMGAMENKGLNIFNDRLVLASPETATDRNFADIERVIAHEYFHNWTGNRITCRDWFQLCLKEGLTVYRDQEFSSDVRSRAVQRIQDVRTLKARQFPEDAGPLAHPVRPDQYIEINNFYTATVYEKGAELCRMLATLLGETAFRSGMDLYFDRHDGQAVTIEDFIACFAEAANRNLQPFFAWYAQSGTPELVCQVSQDLRAGTAQLVVEQVHAPSISQPKKKPVLMPLRVGLIGRDGHDLPLVLHNGEVVENGLLEVRHRRDTWRFKNVREPVVPSLNRGFSAPVNLTVSLSDADLAFLMARDSDSFNRWQATQDYACRILVSAVSAIAKGARPERPVAFLAALTAAASDESLDPAFRAQLLSLPTEGDVARIIGRDLDPAAIHKSILWLQRTTASTMGATLEALYTRNGSSAPYEPTGEQAARRALRLAALSLLTRRGRTGDIERLVTHYNTARNATDEISALGLIANQREAVRTPALERYHTRWKHDHIMIDHWFSCQASATLAGVLQTIKRLTTHPQFSLRNPNKVRALLFAFATANPLHFNRPDGKGYAYIAEMVQELDTINPQMAARLAGAFRNWSQLESGRRQLAKRALKFIQARRPLSKDVAEVVGKILT